MRNSFLLKMSHVKKLFNLKYKKGSWTQEDCILVIEPQRYDKITKLCPNHFMFSENKINNKYVGYFYNYKKKLYLVQELIFGGLLIIVFKIIYKKF